MPRPIKEENRKCTGLCNCPIYLGGQICFPNDKVKKSAFRKLITEAYNWGLIRLSQNWIDKEEVKK